MRNIIKVPALPDGKRPETGPMQFGGDWPGIFIRGDDAMALQASPERLLKLLQSCHDARYLE